MVSGSAIRGGIKSVLTSASMFDAAQVSVNDYAILGRTSNCAIIVQPPDVDVDPHAFGRDWAATYSFPCEGYIRDRGQSAAVLNDVTRLIDDFLTAIQADESLNSTACAAAVTRVRVSRAAFGPNVLDAGGQSWIPVVFTVEALARLARG